jgi:hypothetical protein
MSFEKDGYEVIDNVISADTAKLLAIEFQMIRDNVYLIKGIDLNDESYDGDWQVDKCFGWYSAFCFESLLLLVQPTLEKIVGKRLYPTYTYGRIYYNGATMVRHTDRPACQYSATMTISIDDTGPWEIWIRNLDGVAKPLIIPTGSMAVYYGHTLEHWREEPYKGKKQIQAFLHFVDADGIYADQKYDGREMLGSSAAPKK